MFLKLARQNPRLRTRRCFFFFFFFSGVAGGILGIGEKTKRPEVGLAGVLRERPGFSMKDSKGSYPVQPVVDKQQERIIDAWRRWRPESSPPAKQATPEWGEAPRYLDGARKPMVALG